MAFNSVPFIILFPLAALLYFLIPKRFRYVWLLVLSYAFYIAQGKGFALLLAVTSLIAYITGIALDHNDSPAGRKAVLALCVAADLGILFVFKYLDFTLGLFGSGLRFNLVMPVGISFYTFMSVSYVADVYKKKIEAEKNVLKLALYVSFFLSILSGPINRAGDILPQFTDAPNLSLDDAKRGMQKMLWGYFLKLAIAGRLAIVVDNVYGNLQDMSGFAVVFAALAYTFMLYCDFEGYSQIAIGCGYILGIKMKENFYQPLYSCSFSELWRRWHISLSSWFRDYLYIPLGGSRKGEVRKYINLFIVMVVSGMWHGASVTFFIWGILSGIFLVAGNATMPVRLALNERIKKKLFADSVPAAVSALHRAFKRLGVYLIFSGAFIFFANDSIGTALNAFSVILTRFVSASPAAELFSLGLGKANLFAVIIMAAFVIVADGAAYKRSEDTPSLITRIPTVIRWGIYYAILIAILFSANLTGKEFIYSNM